MLKLKRKLSFLLSGLIVSGSMLLISFVTSNTASVISQNAPIQNRTCVIIDAGHGGVDGGAISCTGVCESNINLEIALKLNDVLHLLGIHTKMIRSTDCSIYTKGDTIASKKVSDLKERVRITNETENGILVSIHQNKFVESRYSGAQVFYADTEGSKELAEIIQSSFAASLNQNNSRKIKKSNSVYLLENINKTGVLVECGFLSNPEEEARLRNPEYQLKIASVIAASCSQYLGSNDDTVA